MAHHFSRDLLLLPQDVVFDRLARSLPLRPTRHVWKGSQSIQGADTPCTLLLALPFSHPRECGCFQGAQDHYFTVRRTIFYSVARVTHGPHRSSHPLRAPQLQLHPYPNSSPPLPPPPGACVHSSDWLAQIVVYCMVPYELACGGRYCGCYDWENS